MTRLTIWLVVAAAVALAQPPQFVPGRVLVKFRNGVSEAQGRAAAAGLGAQSTRVLPRTGVHVVSLPPGAEAAFLRSFQQRGDVEFAELDRIVPPADLTPNDPYYASEWHLPRIAAPTAWSVTTGSPAVVVAIVDSGVDGAHPDLASKMVPGWNIYDNNSNTADVAGHGTMVAGTAAAAGNNGTGVAGVCWNCYIMPVRISDPAGGGTWSNIASGITWAADHGARVANVSYIVAGSSTVSSAASYFQSRGGVVTVSAGNFSQFDPSPDNPYLIIVSATDANDNIYYWSNTGNNVDLSAPGCTYTTTSGGGYGSNCGTSFSAPIVAGVAALLLSATPGMTPAQVTSQLEQTADDKGPAGWDPSYGWGRVNAGRALGGVSAPSDTTPPSISITSPANGSTTGGTVTIQTTASDNVGVASVLCAIDGVAIGLITSAPFNCPWNTTIAGNGSHTVTAKASDAAGNSSTAAETITVSNLPPAGDSTAPTIAILSPANGASVSGAVSVTVKAQDNVGVVRVELYVDGALSASSAAAPFTTAWSANRAKKGSHTLQTRAYDAAGNVGVSAAITVYR